MRLADIRDVINVTFECGYDLFGKCYKGITGYDISGHDVARMAHNYLVDKNERLKDENISLRGRISSLTAENILLKITTLSLAGLSAYLFYTRN